VEDVLIKKKVKSIFLVGGVASNRSLRERFKEISSKYKVKAYFPSKIYCTDNAAMIAGLGYLKYKKKKFSDFRLDAHSRLTLN
jgi:N6-L-threonylcarbamoyladenine synthase